MIDDRIPPDRSGVGTERPHPESSRLDGMDTRELVGFLAADQHRAVSAVESVSDELARLVELRLDTWAQVHRWKAAGAMDLGTVCNHAVQR